MGTNICILSVTVFVQDSDLLIYSSNIEKLLEGVALPRMFRLTQTFPNDRIADAAAETWARLKQAGVASLIRPGVTVAVTGSSRGISNMNIILRETAVFLRKAGDSPFIIPAMGSHGGSTAEGQRQILTGYGITEEFCGCPIRSSMETVRLGEVRDGDVTLPVYIDRLAHEADGIVVVNCIKPHSAFRGPVESGLTKMICTSLGKQRGADNFHRNGFGTFAARIPLVGNYVRTHAIILFGVGTIENAYDETSHIVVLRNEEIPRQEPALLEYAKSMMPRILVPETDVLVVKEIGKNFSGSGMDPNITGTWSTPYGGIRKQRTCVLDLTDASHGNGLGIGQADTTMLRFFNKMDFLATYSNALTSTVFLPVKLAIVLRDDEMAIKAAAKTCNGVDPAKLRIVLIRNSGKAFELQGLTVGIIGFGDIGRRVGRLCRALGMRLQAYDPYLSAADIESQGAVPCGELSGLLSSSDIVTIHTPLDNETRGLLRLKHLRQMKPTALLINCARGGIVEEAALVQALREATIRTATMRAEGCIAVLRGRRIRHAPERHDKAGGERRL